MKKIIFIISILLFTLNSFAQEYEQIIFSENFDKAKLPKGWQISGKGNKKWEFRNFVQKPFSIIDKTNKASALVRWDKNEQDCWLRTPWINIDKTKSLHLLFYWGANPAFIDKINDEKYITNKYGFDIYIRNNKNRKWEKLTPDHWSAEKNLPLWSDSIKNIPHLEPEQDALPKNVWLWINSILSVKQKTSDKIQLAFRYKGKNGDLLAIDNIRLMQGYEYTQTDIRSFTLDNQIGKTEINYINKSIKIEVPPNTSLKGIAPSITYDGAIISPENKKTVDFEEEKAKIYTVTAHNPKYKEEWKVKIYYRDYKGEILSFYLEQQTKEAQIDTASRTVNIEVKYGTNLKALKPLIKISEGAEISPPSNSIIEFEEGKQKVFKVQPVDKSIDPKIWQVKVAVQKVKDGNDIEAFEIEGSTSKAVIDKDKKSIKIEVGCQVNLSKLAPKIKVSEEATISPPSESEQNFIPNKAFVYKVQSSNPDIEPAEWSVFVSVKDYLADIYSFELPFETRNISINNEDRIIKIAVNPKQNLTNVIPKISISECADIEPSPTKAQDFERGEPFYYYVQPANKSLPQVKWTIIFSDAVLLERFDNEKFPPENWTLKTTNKSATWEKNKLPVLPFGNINPATKYSAVCSWSSIAQDEQLISPSFMVNNTEVLSVRFYAAWHSEHQKAKLSLYVIRENEKNKVWESLSGNKGLHWEQINVNLSKYINQEIKLSWEYKGSSGDLVAIDDIIVSNGNLTNVEVAESLKTYCYPNPTKGIINIKSSHNSDFKIYNIKGAVVKTGILKIGTNNISVSQLPEGIYFIEILTKQKKEVLKFIIQP